MYKSQIHFFTGYYFVIIVTTHKILCVEKSRS